MKVKLFSLALIVFAIAFSCEKDANDTITIAEQLDANAPVDPENGLIRRPGLAEIEVYKSTYNPANEVDQLIRMDDSRKQAELRSDYFFSVPTKAVKSIACGNTINGTLTDGTSKFSNATYLRFNLVGSLNGRDDIYTLTLPQPAVVTLSLRNTTENLAMVLFEGTVVRTPVNDNSIPSSIVQLKSVEDFTNSASDYGDLIGPVFLPAGSYVLAIDGPSGQESHYSLKMNCDYLTGNPDQPTSNGSTLIKDKFDDYNVGNDLSPQANHWVKYRTDAKLDAKVFKSSNSLNQYAYFAHKEGIVTNDQPNVILRTGTRASGRYQLQTKLWVNQGRNARIGIIKRFSAGNTSNEVGAQIYFTGNGNGIINVNSKVISFTYPQSEWMTVRIAIDFTSNKYELSINGIKKASWDANWEVNSATGSKRIEAFQFQATANNAQFYLDDLSFNKE